VGRPISAVRTGRDLKRCAEDLGAAGGGAFDGHLSGLAEISLVDLVQLVGARDHPEI
jgi:hypothetical protein